MLMCQMRSPTAAVLALSAASCRLRTSVFLAPASAAAREGRSRSSVVGSLLATPYDMNMSPFLVAMGSTERRSSSCTAASTFAGSQPCPAASALSSARQSEQPNWQLGSPQSCRSRAKVESKQCCSSSSSALSLGILARSFIEEYLGSYCGSISRSAPCSSASVEGAAVGGTSTGTPLSSMRSNRSRTTLIAPSSTDCAHAVWRPAWRSLSSRAFSASAAVVAASAARALFARNLARAVAACLSTASGSHESSRSGLTHRIWYSWRPVRPLRRASRTSPISCSPARVRVWVWVWVRVWVRLGLRVEG